MLWVCDQALLICLALGPISHCGDRLKTSESDDYHVYRRQILTIKVDHRTIRVKVLIRSISINVLFLYLSLKPENLESTE